jgi:hypothetical protein
MKYYINQECINNYNYQKGRVWNPLMNRTPATCCACPKRRPVVDFTKGCKSKISRKCEFQPIKNLEITLAITLTINLRLTTFCEIDSWIFKVLCRNLLYVH